MKYTFIVMVYGYWGKGQSIADAVSKVKSMGARGTDKAYAAIVMGDDRAEVTDMGSIAYSQGSQLVQIGYGLTLNTLAKLQVR